MTCVVSAMNILCDGLCRVLQMTMVLPTFPERKVGRTEGYFLVFKP